MVRCQKPLRGIGQCFPRAENATVVGRDETIALGKDRCNSQARYACRCCQAGGDQLSTRKRTTHDGSFPAALRPVIMARMRFLNPARHTIAMWTRRKRTSATETKK